MAVARHILIMCGSAEIDGYAFCLGLAVLQRNLEESMCQITYLIRGAIFRSRHMLEKQDGISLGELADMYHAQNASIRNDKVYALRGMSSDSLDVAGLKPDYTISWEVLMRSLVKFLLGDLTLVYTCNN